MNKSVDRAPAKKLDNKVVQEVVNYTAKPVSVWKYRDSPYSKIVDQKSLGGQKQNKKGDKSHELGNGKGYVNYDTKLSNKNRDKSTSNTRNVRQFSKLYIQFRYKSYTQLRTGLLTFMINLPQKH
jgi:hypothetical protein